MVAAGNIRYRRNDSQTKRRTEAAPKGSASESSTRQSRNLPTDSYGGSFPSIADEALYSLVVLHAHRVDVEIPAGSGMAKIVLNAGSRTR